MTNSLGNKKIMANNIRRHLDSLGLNVKDFATLMNFKYTTVLDWVNAKTYPRIDKIELMANYFKVDKSDLVERYTPSTSLLQQINDTVVQLTPPNQKIVLRTSEELLESQNEEEAKINEVSEVINLYQVEVVSETAAACGFNYGFGYDDTDRETIEVDEQPPRHDIATKVSGNSMQPDYQDGDILYLVDKGLTTYNGDLAVIAYGDRSYFKKIYTENGRLRLVSLNDKYEDIILDFPPAEDTHIKIFAVVGVYREK